MPSWQPLSLPFCHNLAEPVRERFRYAVTEADADMAQSGAARQAAYRQRRPQRAITASGASAPGSRPARRSRWSGWRGITGSASVRCWSNCSPRPMRRSPGGSTRPRRPGRPTSAAPRRSGVAEAHVLMRLNTHPFQGLCLLKQTGPDADGGNFAQDEGSFAQVRCKISSRARGGGVMLVHQ